MIHDFAVRVGRWDEKTEAIELLIYNYANWFINPRTVASYTYLDVLSYSSWYYGYDDTSWIVYFTIAIVIVYSFTIGVEYFFIVQIKTQ